MYDAHFFSFSLYTWKDPLHRLKTDSTEQNMLLTENRLYGLPRYGRYNVRNSKFQDCTSLTVRVCSIDLYQFGNAYKVDIE